MRSGRMVTVRGIAESSEARAGALGFAVVAVPGFDDGGYFESGWGWETLALAAIVGLALLFRERIDIGRFEIGLLAVLAALALWILLSRLWGIAGTSAGTEAERAFLYVVAVAALVLVVEPASAAAVLAGVVAGACALVSYGLVQLALSGDSDPYEGSLLADPIGYANAMGAIAAIAIVLAVGLALGPIRAPARVLCAGAVVLSVIALVFTESRGAWIALFCGLVFLGALHLDRRRVVSGRRLAALVVVVAAAAVAVVVAKPLSVALGDRPDYWHAALDDAAEHPLLGSGAGTFEEYWDAHGDPGITVRDAHSLYLETFAELGVIGLALVLAAIAIPFVAFARDRGRIGAAAAAGLVGYVVHAGLDWDWEMPAVTLAGLVCAVAVLVSVRGTNPVVLAGVSRYVALGAALVVCAGAALRQL